MRHVRPWLLLALCSAPACGDAGGGETGTADTTSATSTTSAATGTSGEPTSGDDPTGPAAGQFCAEQCRVDADCTIQGNDINFRCIAGVCDVPACAGDGECVALFSGWIAACDGADACAPSEACVDAGGEGRCALVPGDAMSCAQVGLAEVTRASVPDGTVITVCGNDEAQCIAGLCEDLCETDDDCLGVPGTPSCDAATGACVCRSDADCQMSGFAGFVACLPDGQCGCVADSDCTGVNTDRCYDGLCGCSSQAVCTSPAFDNTTLVCR